MSLEMLQMKLDSLANRVNHYPRYVFSRATPQREIGAVILVRNGLDDSPRLGTIVEPFGSAWRVESDGLLLIVHDPEDSWE